MEKMKARVAVMNRRLRIRDLSEQRDALSMRISTVEAEFAQLAHEFKTPLGGILGLLEVTETGMSSGGGREQTARYVKHMRGCAQYLSAMVDDAFDVTRIARGQFQPVIEDFELSALLESLALVSASKSGDDVAFPADLAVRNVRVRSDRNRLLQILINLVVNAVRYADRRGTVRVACALAPTTVTLTVENACAAVTKAQLDGYIDGGRGVAENSKGLGIGLPLVGKLAEGIGAQLSTTVSDGVVKFSVTVPRA
jgi:signal transduction histidine kinase